MLAVDATGPATDGSHRPRGAPRGPRGAFLFVLLYVFLSGLVLAGPDGAAGTDGSIVTISDVRTDTTDGSPAGSTVVHTVRTTDGSIGASPDGYTVSTADATAVAPLADADDVDDADDGADDDDADNHAFVTTVGSTDAATAASGGIDVNSGRGTDAYSDHICDDCADASPFVTPVVSTDVTTDATIDGSADVTTDLSQGTNRSGPTLAPPRRSRRHLHSGYHPCAQPSRHPRGRRRQRGRPSGQWVRLSWQTRLPSRSGPRRPGHNRPWRDEVGRLHCHPPRVSRGVRAPLPLPQLRIQCS